MSLRDPKDTSDEPKSVLDRVPHKSIQQISDSRQVWQLIFSSHFPFPSLTIVTSLFSAALDLHADDCERQ